MFKKANNIFLAPFIPRRTHLSFAFAAQARLYHATTITPTRQTHYFCQLSLSVMPSTHPNVKINPIDISQSEKFNRIAAQVLPDFEFGENTCRVCRNMYNCELKQFHELCYKYYIAGILVIFLGYIYTYYVQGDFINCIGNLHFMLTNFVFLILHTSIYMRQEIYRQISNLGNNILN